MKVVIVVMLLKEEKVVMRDSPPITPTQTRVITNVLNLNTSDTLVLHNNQTKTTITTILSYFQKIYSQTSRL